MNREDLLKRCVDRRVAHETSVVAVSHLFYVYLLSALKKGQQVEVPNFGTFGTNMVGVKRQRKMPFFEVERDLAEKVNERYRNLKTLLVGKFQVVPVEGEVEYTGPEPKYDSRLDTMGKEMVLDTDRDVSSEEFESGVLEPTVVSPEREAEEITPIEPPVVPPEDPQILEQLPREEEAPRLKERKLMPRPNINLRDESTGEEPQPVSREPEGPTPPPTLRDISGSEGPSAWVQILAGILILGAITFALNYLGIIHLWGKKGPTQVEESLPPATQPAPTTEESLTQGQPSIAESLAQKTEPTPTPIEGGMQQPVEEKKEEAKPPVTTPPAVEKGIATTPPAGTGTFTIQVSSWTSRSDADKVVTRLSNAGFDAYIAEGRVKGRTWYRVRVGRYATSADAQAGAAKLRSVSENGVWVTKID